MSVPAATDTWPVFVVGMNGSGTTMLLDCIGRHPELYAFPKETRLIPYLMSREVSFGDLSDDDNYAQLWDTVCTLSVFKQANNGKPVPRPENWREGSRSLARVLDGAFCYFAAQENKQRWCEKTPQHVQHIIALSERFPRAKFIHVIRDGRDCAASFNRRWLRSPTLTIFRWKKVVMGGHRQGLQLGPERYLDLRYEDLTDKPEYWLGKVCDFLSVPFDAAILESNQPYLQKKEDGQGGLQRNSGKWESYFGTGTKHRLENIAGRTLHAFGYQTNQIESDKNLSDLQRKILSTKDALLQYCREISLKIRGKIERPWKVILGKPFIAIRQRRQNRF